MTLREFIKREIKSILFENRSYFNAKDATKIYKDIASAMKIKLPNVRFKDVGRKKINLDDGTEITFSFGQGILVIENLGSSIKNFNQVLQVVKKYFGDVDSKGNKDYINARDFGMNYDEQVEVINPKALSKLIKFKKSDFEGLTRTAHSRILTPIRTFVDGRKATIKGKARYLKFTVVKKFKHPSFKVVELNGDIYATDSFDLYYSKNLKEAEEIIKLLLLETDILRQLEVSSWDVTRMGKLGQLD